jgi:hypothetical protein
MTTGDILADLARRIISICNAALHKPMADAIEAARTDISKIMENAETAGWLVPSALLGGAGFSLSVSPNAAKPYDHMDVSYDLSVSGVARFFSGRVSSFSSIQTKHSVFSTSL